MKETDHVFSWGVSATYGLWDGKLRGKSAEEAFGDTEAHNLKSRDVTMVNKCLFFLYFLQPDPSSCALFNKRPGNKQFCSTIPHQK